MTVRFEPPKAFPPFILKDTYYVEGIDNEIGIYFENEVDDFLTISYSTSIPTIIAVDTNTATPGSDYSPVSGTIELNPRESKRITLSILDDNLVEFSLEGIELTYTETYTDPLSGEPKSSEPARTSIFLSDYLFSEETATLPSGVEILVVNAQTLDLNIDGTGNNGPNFIKGGSGQNDRLSGGGGDDTLNGGSGFQSSLAFTREVLTTSSEIDTLTGGPGKDTFFLGGGTYESYSDGVADRASKDRTAAEIKAIMPNATTANINKYLSKLNKAMEEFEINTPERQQAFLAQISVETGDLSSAGKESLYYKSKSPKQIAMMFGEAFGWPDPKKPKFKNLSKAERAAAKEAAIEEAKKYLGEDGKINNSKEEEAFANKVYANVNGNGNEESGDGSKYRGRGLIQITRKGTYKKIGGLIGENLEGNPDLVLKPEVAARTAAAFWKDNNLNELADAGEFRKLTKKVNAKAEGYKERLKAYERAKKTISSLDPNETSYALITDFDPAQDTIRLGSRSLNYSLNPLPKAAGVAILSNDELIGIVQGNTKGLTLEGNYFQFVE